MRSVQVVAPGPLTTVQDAGRPGYAALGVPRSGAADRPAYELANRLVGNPDGAAALEVTLGGLEVWPAEAMSMAVTGAPCPVRVGRRAAAWGEPLAVGAGEVVRLGRPQWGVRSYLAAAGGFDGEPVLGSRSTDLLSGLGPPPLRAGDELPVGHPPGVVPPADVPVLRPPADPQELRILRGPRADWFSAEALADLGAAGYTVAAESNRIGVRLSGLPLARAVEEELPSEGIVLGAVQVPPDGQPVVFLADHPTTGGYPVVGVVVTADLPVVAQLAPGERVRLALLP